MTASTVDIFELHPKGKVYLQMLEEAYELHRSCSVTMRLASGPPGTDSTVQAARRNILDVAMKLMLTRRDQLLDEFCADWCRHRRIKV